MIIRDRISAVALFIFGAAAFLVANQYPVGAALFPQLVSGVIVLCAIAIGVRSFFSGYQPVVFEEADVSYGWKDPVLPGLALTILFVVAVRYLGYITATTVFIPVAAYCFGVRDWRWLVIGTVGFVLLSSMLFIRIFHTPLPRDLLLTWF
jgi:putative tricarboxylic transport membrane protein